jgi:hypothetical protein
MNPFSSLIFVFAFLRGAVAYPAEADAVVVKAGDDTQTRIFTGNTQNDNVLAAGVVGLGIGVGGVLLTQAFLDSQKPKCKRDLAKMFGLGGGQNYDCGPSYRPPRPHGGYREPHRPYRPSSGYQEPHRPHRPSSGYREPYRPSHGYEEPHRPSSGYREPHRPSSGYREPHRPSSGYREPHRPSSGYREPASSYREPYRKPHREEYREPTIYRPTTDKPAVYHTTTYRAPYYDDYHGPRKTSSGINPFEGRSLAHEGEADKEKAIGEPRGAKSLLDDGKEESNSSGKIRFED